jgi:uncharacterized membrane protein
MNSYEPSTPRAAFGLAAVAMAAISIGAMVVLPAKMDSISADAVTLASAKAGPTAVEVAISPAPIEVAISPARIEVIGVREPNVAWALSDATRPCKPEG